MVGKHGRRLFNTLFPPPFFYSEIRSLIFFCLLALLDQSCVHILRIGSLGTIIWEKDISIRDQKRCMYII